MKTEVVKIDLLKEPEKNVRIHTEKQYEELYRSYKMFGQYRPVVVDENNVVLAGNGFVEALRRNGHPKKFKASKNSLKRQKNAMRKQSKCKSRNNTSHHNSRFITSQYIRRNQRTKANIHNLARCLQAPKRRLNVLIVQVKSYYKKAVI